MIHLTAYQKTLVRFAACGTDTISFKRNNPRRFIIIIIGILVVTWRLGMVVVFIVSCFYSFRGGFGLR